MTATQFEGAISSALKALDDWNTFLDDLLAISGPESSKFELSIAIPSLDPTTSIEELGQKLSGAVALVQELSEIESTLLIPDAITTTLLARVAAVRATVEALLSQVNALPPEHKIASLDPKTLAATNDQGRALNVGPALVELYTHVQSLLASVYQLRGIARLSGKGGLALELTQMQAARSAQRRALGDFKRLTRALEVQRKELEALATSAKAAGERIVALEAQANGEITRVAESKQKAEELIAAATASEQSALKLKEVVDAYSKSFATFQNDLDTRNVAFEKGKADLQTFIKDSEQQRDALIMAQTERHKALSDSIEIKEKEIEGILKRSRAVLGEATVSGLSDSFAKEMTEARDQLWWIQLLFFASVGLLLVGAAVVLDAFPWLGTVVHIAKIETPSSGAPMAVAVYLLANFLRTLTFLLAPLVLLIYAARRYTELFRMKAHYTYKYTVAASLPGFKLEAPKYAEEITASAFEELLFNPGDSVGKPEDATDKGGNTFVQRLLEPIIKKAMDKMGEVSCCQF
jgi:hypothetical protein